MSQIKLLSKVYRNNTYPSHFYGPFLTTTKSEAALYYLQFLTNAGPVDPVGWEAFELICVDETQHDHGVNDHDPPESVDCDPPPAIRQL